MASSNEQLAIRFVELIAKIAVRKGQAMPRWNALPLALAAYMIRSPSSKLAAAIAVAAGRLNTWRWCGVVSEFITPALTRGGASKSSATKRSRSRRALAFPCVRIRF
jgi:hypothetical protein